tara:strand:+ start:311 stop:463 length:153 start_codon:yes stop_codon:yes gene_type:complete
MKIGISYNLKIVIVNEFIMEGIRKSYNAKTTDQTDSNKMEFIHQVQLQAK